MSQLVISHEIRATKALMERVQSSPDEYSVLVPAGNDALHYGSSMDVQWAHFGLTPNVVFSIFNGLSVIETIKNCDRITLALETLPEWSESDIDLDMEAIEVSKQGIRFVGRNDSLAQHVRTEWFSCTDILNAVEQLSPGDYICHINFVDQGLGDEIVALLADAYNLDQHSYEQPSQYASPRG